jgi:putative PEP-CTERM system TPR-repeat lipoprotein
MRNAKGVGGRAGWVTLAAALLLTACEKDKSISEAEHLERAKTFQAQGKHQSFVIEIKNLLQKNPNHAEGHFLLGENYANLGYGIDAEKELLRAKELGIDPERVKVPLGKSLLDQKEYKRVFSEIRPAIASSTITVAGIKTLYAQAEIGLKQFEKGCELFREAKQTDNKYIPAYWGIAQCSLGFGKPIEAAEELDAALKIDDKNADTWLLRGDLWRGQKHGAEAEKAYTTGLTHKPEHLMLLLARASVRILNDNHAGATDDINGADKQFKDHPLVLHYRGVLSFKEKKYSEAKASFERVLSVNPDYLPTVLWAGLTDYALNNLEQASRFFAQYVSAVPNATQVEAFLAITRARLGGKNGAAELLAKLGAVDINDPQSLVLIGQAHLLTGDQQAGARYLARAIERKPDLIDLRMNLVSALLQKGDKTEAIHHAEEVLKKSPNDPRANRVMIAALLENGQADKALEILKNFEKAMPDSPIPLIYRSAIKIKQNDLKAAKLDLEKALKLQPGNALVGHSLAGIAIQENQLDEARKYYQQVREKHNDPLETLMAMYDLEVLAKDKKVARQLVETASSKYPKAPRPATIIASAYARAGLPDKAIELSSEAASANPDDPELLAARGAAFIDKGEIPNALANFNRIVKLRPDWVEAHVKLAMVQEATGNFTGLKSSLANALRLDPKHRRARLMLASQNVRDKKFEEALTAASLLEQDFPNGIDAHILQSKVLMQLKRESEAVAALERAQKVAPKSEIPVIEMAKLRFFAGQNDLGFKALKSWLQANPNNIRGNAFLAESYLAFKKNDEALEAYKKIVTIEPENLIALNNIANLLGDKDPKLALPYAEKAYASYPVDPAIADTLGWLLVRTGDEKRGLDLIKKAVDVAPGSPDIQFHYAFALAQTGDKGQAKRELENLLKNQKDFPSRAEAQALLATL